MFICFCSDAKVRLNRCVSLSFGVPCFACCGFFGDFIWFVMRLAVALGVSDRLFNHLIASFFCALFSPLLRTLTSALLIAFFYKKKL